MNASAIPAWVIVMSILSIGLLGLLGLYFCTRGISPHPRTRNPNFIPENKSDPRAVTPGPRDHQEVSS